MIRKFGAIFLALSLSYAQAQSIGGGISNGGGGGGGGSTFGPLETGPGATGGTCTSGGGTCLIATALTNCTQTLTGSTGTLMASDAGGAVCGDYASAGTLTLENLTTSQFAWFINQGAGTWTLSPNSGSIEAGPITVAQGQSVLIGFDGTNWWIYGGAGSGGASGITVGTTTITSGTSGRVPYNDAGVYGEISGFTSDGTNGIFGATNLRVLGSSTGYMTLETLNAGATDYAVLFPAANDTVAELGQANAFTGANTNSYSGTASTAAMLYSGAPYTGGSATTNVPLIYLNDGTAPTTWNANGTEFGINTPSGFNGNLIDAHVNGGASVFTVFNSGAVTIANAYTSTYANTGFYHNGSVNGASIEIFRNTNTGGSALIEMELGNNNNNNEGSLTMYGSGYTTTALRNVLAINGGDATNGGGLELLGQTSEGIYIGALGAVQVTTGLEVGAPTGGQEGTGTVNAASGYYANGTQGLASKTCTINAANVATGITITIVDGIITGTTTC